MYFIYFIKVADNIKIGICKATLKNLKQRLSEANRWSPNSEILGVIYTRDKEDEKKLHIYFKEYQISSEVFTAHKNIIKFIKKYCNWAIGRKYILHFTATNKLGPYPTLFLRKGKKLWEDEKQEYKENILDQLDRIKRIKESLGYFNHEIYDQETKEISIKEAQNRLQMEINFLKEIKGIKRLTIQFIRENLQTIFLTWQEWAKKLELEEVFYYEDKTKEDNKQKLKKIDCELLMLSVSNIGITNYRDITEKIYLPSTNKADYEDERDDDFTGIGDDGFHYVDGEFNICDPLGIEAY